MAQSELLPCPFCGGAMELVHDHTIENIDHVRHKLPSIDCPINGASGFSVGNDQLIAAWNTRPQPAISDDLVEVAARAIDASYENGGDCEDAALQVLAAVRPILEAQGAEKERLYNDLIMQVACKFPNETRHETARRYIIERESREVAPAAAIRKLADRAAL